MYDIRQEAINQHRSAEILHGGPQFIRRPLNLTLGKRDEIAERRELEAVVVL